MALVAVVGGVGELYQGDLDLGRHAVERLAATPPGPDVAVEDFFYGALAVTQRLAELAPPALVLVSGVRRGRPPASVHRRRVHATADPARTQLAVTHAGTGYVDVDLLVDVAAGLGALPARTVAFEVEPVSTMLDERLSPLAQEALGRVLVAVGAEIARLPLLALADQLGARARRYEPTPVSAAVRALLAELVTLDEEGRFAGTFAARDRLRLALAEGAAPDGAEGLDWALWWALLEELDRLQGREVVPG